MKKHFSLLAGVTTVLTLASCGSSKPSLYLETFAPEESGLNLVKITDEAAGSVLAGGSFVMVPATKYSTKVNGYNSVGKIAWGTQKNLAVSPDGTKLAYVTFANKQSNVIVRNTSSQGISTQRTFRNVSGGFCWGPDNRIYFGDSNTPNYYIASVDAMQGSTMLQHTNGNVDDSQPAVSSDGKILFFTRWTSTYGPSIWSLNKENGTLSSCARGYNPCCIPGNNNAFYCTRNTTDGKSEIWYVDYVKGQESIILSDANRSFTNPALSPNGKWLLVVGNAQSSISKKQNLDIYAVRTDGTQLTQLTFHPQADTCPTWSKDGRSIYFISSRANKDTSYNIWRMNFNLE